MPGISPSPDVSDSPFNLPLLSSVPEAYHDLGEAFSKQRLLCLGYHPQSEGPTERTNQTLEKALPCVAA